MVIGDLIRERAASSKDRLDEFKEEVDKILPLKETQDLCIYITGSYGRCEATRYSDLDIFFVHRGEESESTLPIIKKTLIDADLVRCAENLGFPPFSNDGKYLSIHYVDDIVRELGSPADDFRNFFTARLLLLLESKFVYNEDVYKEVIEKIVWSYYRDFHTHENDFKPVFFINDLVRFWRTLCLNYEHKRNRPAERQEARNKSHLKNLKLKFSRLLTCFSTMLMVVQNPDIVTHESFIDTVYKTPVERVMEVALAKPELKSDIDGLIEKYEWFLKKTEGEKESVLKWISDKEERNSAFGKAREFSDCFYNVIKRVAKDDIMRYLVM